MNIFCTVLYEQLNAPVSCLDDAWIFAQQRSDDVCVFTLTGNVWRQVALVVSETQRLQTARHS